MDRGARVEINLESLREKINLIDQELVELFEQRMEIVTSIAEHKRRSNKDIYDSNREKKVIEQAKSQLKNENLEEYLVLFLENLMAISRQYQGDTMQCETFTQQDIDVLPNTDILANTGIASAPEKKQNIPIGFYGQIGSFSEEATIQYFGDGYVRKGYSRFDEVISALLNDEISVGVLPVENSSTGTISDVMDLIRDNDIYITGELIQKIRQHLLVIPGTKLSDIETVYSHHQGIEQTSKFLKQHSFEQIIFKSTADSARLVKELGDKTKAAIGSQRCADIYGLEILAPDIHYNNNNYTRFITIEKNLSVNSDCNKISIIMDIAHRTGALFDVLRLFKHNSINLIKIESRPIIGEPWQYMFFFDFEGNLQNDSVQTLLKCLKGMSQSFRLLGNYVSQEI
ncbi:MAG TPA: chorismate mutase [Thermoclostridium sp.]|nr:chorismate mutase [Thermoclostridium sp.]